MHLQICYRHLVVHDTLYFVFNYYEIFLLHYTYKIYFWKECKLNL